MNTDLSFMLSKSYCVVLKPKLCKSSCPELFIGIQHLNYVGDTKYLGVIRHLVISWMIRIFFAICDYCMPS